MHKFTKQQTAQLSPPFESVLDVHEQKEVEVDWIGFSNKTMWDWLLLFSTLAIPLVVLCATIVFSIQQERMSDAQHTNELKIAAANRQNDLKMAHDQEEENTLAAYLDGLTTLLLNDKLDSQGATYDASVVARAKTMIVLRRLNDPERKAMVVQFLYEAHLITGKQPRVSLAGADLSNIDLSNIDLKTINLSGAHLNKALLLNTDLSGATLSYADMRGADMRGANMQGADMQGTIVTQSQLQQSRVRQRVLVYHR
jgi:hypothetical protein